LCLDSLAEPSWVTLAVAEPCGTEGIVHHEEGNMRLSPTASGSGLMLKSA
jgi:hypothetical protein